MLVKHPKLIQSILILIIFLTISLVSVNIYIAGNLILLDLFILKAWEPKTGALNMITQGNLIRIGKKPVLSYVVACVTLFNSGKNEIMVRARGRSIPKAVDTVEMLKHSFLKGLFVKSVEIGSEDIKSYDRRGTRVSIIEIILAKKKISKETEN